MKERVKALLFAAAALVAASPASAQVGHDPAKSPYADLEYSQEFTLLGGYMKMRHDPAGILPKGRSMLGGCPVAAGGGGGMGRGRGRLISSL